MCGIAGKVYFNKGRNIASADVKLMTDAIAYRGPDDEGIFISEDKRVGLGNRRLAVIDLSKKAHQPMTYLNRYTITYNGEVYNFQEEREKLEKLGYKFTSNSDTEVILALYDKYKNHCLDHLRGMYAFAIYDQHKQSLFLARDRIGVKPLKYFLNEDCLIFASELKAILTQKEITREVDYKAIQMYLTFGYVPAPLTGFAGIKKLEPGHFLFINLKRKTAEKKRYWEPEFQEKLNLTESEWSDKILSTLTEATRLRMIADVPIGAFLSGGVDSSAIVAAMAAVSDKPIKTFTVKFFGTKFTEEKYAGKIAKIYKTDHHEILAKPSSVEILPMLAHQYEEPYADASSVVTYMVSKMARKYVTVILNGDGADEEFCGYPNRYFRLKRDVNFDKYFKIIRPLASLPLDKKVKKFLEKSKLPIYKRFASYNQCFDFDEIKKHARGKLHSINSKFDPYLYLEKVFKSFKGYDLKDAGMKYDLTYYLPDDLLTKVDIASMAVSLEARSPFLDREMLELSCKIPFNLKVKNGETKYILKRALEKIVPKENLYRPKMGFSVPLEEWFKEKLNKYAQKVLLSKGSFVSKIMDTDRIKRVLNISGSREDFGPRIWALMSLELWHQSFFQ